MEKEEEIIRDKIKKEISDIKKKWQNTWLDSNFNWRFCAKSNLCEK